jgi:hypothetical protein
MYIVSDCIYCKPEKSKNVGWVEERNPTLFQNINKLGFLNPTYDYLRFFIKRDVINIW